MAKSRYELHNERLTTTDELGNRIYLYPEDVKGKWRDRRTIVFAILVFVFLILPWIHFGGKQIILMDLINREFTFFGTTFFAHDSPMLLLILLFFIFLLGLLTSLYGRIWCGWACPQTVFIDLIYRRIELFIEGRASQREKLDKAPVTLNKALKKTFKWFLFLIVSLHISHSFLGYFVGTRNLFWITLGSPTEHFQLFIIMSIFTLIILFDFGWFREQFCLIACPWGRIQSVIMDDNSLVVAYDKSRGEPRRDVNLPKESQGDCVNCYACVKSCPTGIDIRRGNQLECIACTNCIDACDDIMSRVGKEPGLIRYDSENNLMKKNATKFGVRQIFYSIGVLASVIIFVLSLINSHAIKVQFIRSKIPFISNNGEILNQYKMTIDYKKDDLPKISIEIDDTNKDIIEIVTPINPYLIKDGHQKINIFFKFKDNILKNGTYRATVNFKNVLSSEVLVSQEVVLVGPIK